MPVLLRYSLEAIGVAASFGQTRGPCVLVHGCDRGSASRVCRRLRVPNRPLQLAHAATGCLEFGLHAELMQLFGVSCHNRAAFISCNGRVRLCVGWSCDDGRPGSAGDAAPA